MKFRGPNNLEFKNGALYDLFEGGYKAVVNPMENRIVTLYQLLDKGIMPYMWDYEHYSGDSADMYGFFYPEDYNAILQIQQLENAGEKRRAREKK